MTHPRPLTRASGSGEPPAAESGTPNLARWRLAVAGAGARNLRGPPAPAGVHHLSLEPERRIGKRRGHHGDLTPRRLVGTTELVDDFKGRDPPSRPGRSSAHHL